MRKQINIDDARGITSAQLDYIVADKIDRNESGANKSAAAREAIRAEYNRRMKRNAAQAAKDGTK
jgi:hypothetical protein